MPELYRVNVSSVQDFFQCRFRWWCRWVMNRVPWNESPAFGAGKLLHLIFEDALKGDRSMQEAYEFRTQEFYEQAMKAPDIGSRNTAMRAIETIRDLSEALPLWRDKYPITRTLEVEKPFALVLAGAPGVQWLGRPDRISLVMGKLWHIQNRGLAATTNFGTYVTLAKRHYHEHLYAEYAAQAYPEYKVGGTIFNLVRKLKFRTNAGRKNEAIKTAAEMFFQHPMSIDVNGALHRSVMLSMYDHVREMQDVENRWFSSNVIPPPNEKMNGGFVGNSIDPYFLVLTGEVKLSDDGVFKTREDMYAQVEES